MSCDFWQAETQSLLLTRTFETSFPGLGTQHSSNPDQVDRYSHGYSLVRAASQIGFSGCSERLSIVRVSLA